MDNNILDILKLFTNSSNTQNEHKVTISKELKEQYPYGEFPIRYTKSGQETIRKNSEHRFSYDNNFNNDSPSQNSPLNLNIETLLPLIQTLSTNKKEPANLMTALSKILFKDNPQMANLFKLFPMKNNVNITNDENFPNTNKVEISGLKRID